MKNSPRRSAFTLIELLASVGIIAALSALVLAGVGKARNSADRAASVAGLRAIAAGVFNAARDNDGLIPDFYGGQNPGYQNNDPKRMPSRLWAYISSPEPISSYSYARAFMPPAYKRQYKSITGLGTTYLVYNPNPKDADGVSVNMAGKPLAAAPLPSKNWMLVEVDQALYDIAPSIMGGKPGWISNVSKQALNYPMRGVAYWDGRVEMTPASKPFVTQ